MPHISYLMVAGVIDLALSTFHTIVVKQDGSLWSTGLNSNGQLGIGLAIDLSKKFVQVNLDNVRAAAAGFDHSVVVKQDDSVWITGQNSKGQLGRSSPETKRTFMLAKQFRSLGKSVAAGGYHTMVLTTDDRVFATGWNRHGQLGIDTGATSIVRKFREVMSSKAQTIAAGDTHSIVLQQDGSVWATGRNCNGQLGDGSTTDRNTFVKVIAGGAEAVTAGGFHSMVLKEDGSVWSTGCNEYGQLGDGSATDRSNYEQIVPRGAKAVAAGSRHSMMLKRDGSVWAAGYNQYGQLGDGSTTNKLIFMQVISGGVQSVAAGTFHSMLIKQDDSVWATGSSKDGQFGDGSTITKNVFVRVMQTSKGAGHAMARWHTYKIHLQGPTVSKMCLIANNFISRLIRLSSRFLPQIRCFMILRLLRPNQELTLPVRRRPVRRRQTLAVAMHHQDENVS